MDDLDRIKKQNAALFEAYDVLFDAGIHAARRLIELTDNNKTPTRHEVTSVMSDLVNSIEKSWDIRTGSNA